MSSIFKGTYRAGYDEILEVDRQRKAIQKDRIPICPKCDGIASPPPRFGRLYSCSWCGYDSWAREIKWAYPMEQGTKKQPTEKVSTATKREPSRKDVNNRPHPALRPLYFLASLASLTTAGLAGYAHLYTTLTFGG